MNEEQDKPFKKWYRRPAILLILCACVCLLTYLIIMATKEAAPFINTHEDAYNSDKFELRDGVIAYMIENDDMMPIIDGSVNINGSECRIIDICILTSTESEMLHRAPESCVSTNGPDNDNCDGGCEGCSNTSHYIWAIDDNGNVYSTCVDEECEANGEDGYQDVWP